MGNHRVVAAGIDVGGPGKGFHAVALRHGEVIDTFHSLDRAGMASWVRRSGARAVGVDAPCRWRAGGRMRAAERELGELGFRCFATPVQATGEAHPFYAWMRNGLALYEALSGGPAACFETFPQAIACLLAGRMLSAGNKRTERRAVLEAAGIGAGALGSLDLVDAALCAVAARSYLRGDYRQLGDREGGFLLLPYRPER